MNCTGVRPITVFIFPDNDVVQVNLLLIHRLIMSKELAALMHEGGLPGKAKTKSTTISATCFRHDLDAWFGNTRRTQSRNLRASNREN